MKIIFFLSLFFCGYSYFIYPLILKFIPPRRSLISHSDEIIKLPDLSLIITAHNEETRIDKKLQNSLEINYPADLIEIIVASDCSTDTTDSIVESYADRGIRLVRADTRKGKEYAQLCAIRQSKGEILVFSDVATQIEKDALQILANCFSEQNIGAVSSEDRFISQNGKIVGEGAYVRYEMSLRRLESERAGLVGLSGSFFAARRSVCDEWDITIPSDFNTALNCAKKGYVAITCPAVVGIYKDIKDPELEYQRKIRTVIRGIAAIVRHPEVLNPSRMGMFAFQIWSHKIMRWAVPWCLLSLLITSLYLMHEHWVYMIALIGQLLFHSIAFLGHIFVNARACTFVKIPYFFMQVNIAIAHAALQYLFGKRITVWQPSKR